MFSFKVESFRYYFTERSIGVHYIKETKSEFLLLFIYIILAYIHNVFLISVSLVAFVIECLYGALIVCAFDTYITYLLIYLLGDGLRTCWIRMLDSRSTGREFDSHLPHCQCYVRPWESIYHARAYKSTSRISETAWTKVGGALPLGK